MGRYLTFGEHGEMDRRTKMTEAEPKLFALVRRGSWGAKELTWVLDHLDGDAPMELVAELRHRLQQLRQPPSPTRE